MRRTLFVKEFLRITALIITAGLIVMTSAAWSNVVLAAETEVDMDEDIEPALPPIPADLTGGSPWIDSCVEGNITDKTEVSPAEDFYTYVNKDWILSQHIPEGSYTLDMDKFMESRHKVMEVLKGEDLSGHDARQAQLLLRAFCDTDAREEAGCEPARKVIEDIRSITGIRELSDFLLDTERSAGVPSFISVKNRRSNSEHRWVTEVVLSDPTFGATMGTTGMNAENTDPASTVYKARLALVCDVLTRVGYTEEEAAAAFENRLNLEREILRIENESVDEQDSTMSLGIDQLDDVAGDFPLRGLAESRGYGQAEEFVISDAASLHAAVSLYTDDHIDGLRDYLICGYVMEAGGWLDMQAFDAWRADYDANGNHVSLTMPERNGSIEETAVNLASEIMPTLIGRAFVEGCNLEHTREFIEKLCADAIETHKQMVRESDWLSDSTKDRLCEKMDAITVNAVYPDVWEDYSGLDLDGLDYYSARRAIWLNDLARNAALTGTGIDDRLWDSPSLIEGGGAYNFDNNSFHIDACACEGDIARYDAGEITFSELLGGGTGYIVFHEVGHAIDSNNIFFDEKGNDVEESLLKPDELAEYKRRAEKTQTYLDGISIWEGQQVIGEVSMNEALAEICGMQARLLYAAREENFDYRAFFEERARLAPTLHTPEYELMYILGDDHHPSAYLDTNITVQQFDEFAEAYGVKSSDAMYLAPEDRLLLW